MESLILGDGDLMNNLHAEFPLLTSPTRIIDQKLEQLFKLALEGKYEEVLPEVLNRPELVNATLSNWPDEGMTILLIAATQLLSNDDFQQRTLQHRVLRFIHNLIGHDIYLNIDASSNGTSVIWLLYLSLLHTLHTFEALHSLPDLILKLVKKYPNFNLNLAPEKGEFEGVTVFGLMIGIDANLQVIPCLPSNDWFLFLILKHATTFSLSFFSLSKKNEKKKLNIISFFLDKIELFEELIRCDIYRERHMLSAEKKGIVLKCYHHLIEIIANNPNCTLPDNVLAKVLKLEPTPKREELLIALICAGTSLPKMVKNEYKDEYIALKEKLTVFSKAFISYLHGKEHFPAEVSRGIALHMLASAFPNFKSFPESLLRRLLSKFVLPF